MSEPIEISSTYDATSSPKFTAVDYLVFCSMLIASLAIGIYSALKGRGNTSTNDYLLGERSMSTIPVAFSLLGGVISAIAILGNASEMYFFGTQLVTCLLGFLPGCLLIHKITLPIFYNLKLVSLNQYIELRYESRVLRKLVSMLQLLNTVSVMGVCLYAPSLALSTVTNISTSTSVAIMGVVCTIYFSVGGVKAVVYTDVLQTALMFLGVLVVVVICCVDLGGVSIVWNTALRGSRIEFFNLETSLYVRHTLWSTIALGCFIMIYFTGFQQSSYQRFASVNTLQSAKSLCVAFTVGLYFLWLLFYFSGLVAYAVYSDCDPLTSGRISKPDQILPILVMDKLSSLPGVPGIFVAAVYGGVLSSFSSYGNSLACLIWEDFLKDSSYFKDKSEKTATNILKLLSVIGGAIGVALGLVAGMLGNILQVALSLNGALYGPMAGVFLAGICTPWVNAKGATMGCLLSVIYTSWMVGGSFMYGRGSPVPLPLSTEHCGMNMWPPISHSHVAFNTSLVSVTEIDNATTIPGWEAKSIYDISYCYSGWIAILLTILLSNLLSLCTGPLSPSQVTEGVVNPTCRRLHQWLCSVFHSFPRTLGSKNRIHKEGNTKMKVYTLETEVVNMQAHDHGRA